MDPYSSKTLFFPGSPLPGSGGVPTVGLHGDASDALSSARAHGLREEGQPGRGLPLALLEAFQRGRGGSRGWDGRLPLQGLEVRGPQLVVLRLEAPATHRHQRRQHGLDRAGDLALPGSADVSLSSCARWSPPSACPAPPASVSSAPLSSGHSAPPLLE